MDRRRTRGRVLSTGPALVTTDAGVVEVADAVAGADRFALDTEFHRERTYFPKLALVQIAWDDQLVLLDPTEADLAPLADVFAGPALPIIHAASQDLEVLDTHLGVRLDRVWDTQVAAAFLGLSTPSLSSLVDHELGIRLPKGDRLTDWLRRPLTKSQLAYAAADVEHLVEVQRRQERRLDELGRTEWAQGECEELLATAATARDPEEAWRRIKEVRKLRGADLAVARQVAAWRERRAATVDRPVRQVLSDLGVAAISQRRPESPEDLSSVRGVDAGFARSRAARSLLETVAEADHTDVPDADAPARVSSDQRAAVTLASAWLAQHARDLDLDPTLVATRADLEAYLAGDPGSRLRHGWRADVVGRALDRLLAGEAALAFDGRGGLVLEGRSHRPVTPVESPPEQRS